MHQSWKFALLHGLSKLLAIFAIVVLVLLVCAAIVTALPFVLLAIGAGLVLLLAGWIAWNAEELERKIKRSKML